jgi:dTDP-4-dehydrorhamnose reductase
MLTLITGASGQLGKTLRSLVKQKKISHSFVFTSRNQLDLSDLNHIQRFIESHKFDLIINCAAYTGVDKAEIHEKEADLINHLAVKKIAEIAHSFNIKLIHISTDFVFDGLNHQPYYESDVTGPLNIYGNTKLAGEKAVLSIMKFNAIIIRTSWVYSEYGNNFVDTILKLIQKEVDLNIVSDQIGTPTYANDLGNAILSIIESEKFHAKEQESQIYHYSNSGKCNWYDFAKEIINISGSKCNLNAINTADYPMTAERPMCVVMSKKKISHEFGLKITFWKDSLKICMKNLSTLPTSNNH